MKKGVVSWFFFFVLLFCGYAQQEVCRDTVGVETGRSDVEKAGQPDRSLVALDGQPVFEQEKMNLHSREYWIVPRINLPLFMQPHFFAAEYASGGFYYIADTGQLFNYASYSSYPMLGSFMLADVLYTFYHGERLGVSGGSYVSKYSLFTQLFRDYGFNARFSLYPAENFQINWYTRYSVRGEHTGIDKRLAPLYPQNHVGVEFELKPSRNLNFRVGLHGFSRYTR